MMVRASLGCIHRYGLFAPGAVALFFSVIVLFFMKDSPEKEGFPPVDSGKPKKAAVESKPGTRPSPPFTVLCVFLFKQRMDVPMACLCRGTLCYQRREVGQP